MPSLMSFMTCEPTSNVPTQPRSTQLRGFTSRRTRDSETSCQLPGGRIADNRIPSSWPLFPFKEPPISPTATNRIEKKCEQHVEGHGLRNHAALWNDPCQCSEQFLRDRAQRHCRGIIASTM